MRAWLGQQCFAHRFCCAFSHLDGKELNSRHDGGVIGLIVLGRIESQQRAHVEVDDLRVLLVCIAECAPCLLALRTLQRILGEVAHAQIGELGTEGGVDRVIQPEGGEQQTRGIAREVESEQQSESA